MPKVVEGNLSAAGLKFGIVVSRFNHFVRAPSGRHDALVSLGAVMRGATPHFEYVASEVSKGISAASQEFGLPIAFGVLTTDTVEQAIERAGTKHGNKGFDAALSAIEMANLMKEVPKPRGK